MGWGGNSNSGENRTDDCGHRGGNDSINCSSNDNTSRGGNDGDTRGGNDSGIRDSVNNRSSSNGKANCTCEMFSPIPGQDNLHASIWIGNCGYKH